MYRNLEAELARKGITRSMLSKGTGIALSTISKKLAQRSDITLAQAFKIKDFLDVPVQIEDLFAEAAIKKEDIRCAPLSTSRSPNL